MDSSRRMGGTTTTTSPLNSLQSRTSASAPTPPIDRLLDACRTGDDVALVQHLLLQSPTLVNQVGTNGDTPLFAASKHDRLAVVAILVAGGADVNAPTAKGETPLFIASQEGHTAMVAKLLEFEADIEIADKTASTPLLIAAHGGHLDIVRTLLAREAKVNVTDKCKHTPLWYASQNGHEAVVSALLKRGADVDAANVDSQTPLWAAAHQGHARVVTQLLGAGANVDSPDCDGKAPIWIAVLKGRTEVAAVLLAHRASANAVANAVSPLCIACEDGNEDIASSLLAHQANVEFQGPNRWTPLYIASFSGRARVVSLLLRHGARVGAASVDGHTPLIAASYGGFIDVVSELLTHGAAVDARTQAGATPLFFAAQGGHTEVVAELLAHGAPVDAADDFGATPLCVASMIGHHDVVTLLLAHNAELQLTARGTRTPLFFASGNGRVAVVETLLNSGADIDAGDDSDGCTPLYAASQNGHLAAVQVLLARGARVNAPNRDGKTPLRVASRFGRADVVQTLLANGADVDAHQAGGTTALWVAAQNGHLNVVSALLKHRASTEATLANGMTPLWIAAQNGHTAVVSELLKLNARVDAPESRGSSPLWIAAQNGHISTVLALLDAGARVDALNLQRVAPLHVAAARRRIEVVKLLLARGATLDATTSQGWTPLWIASQSGHISVVFTLLARGAIVDALDDDRKTPLWIASSEGHDGVVAVLLRHGASAVAADGTGATPLHIATRQGHTSVISLLLRSRANSRELLEATDNDGNTPLIAAAKNGHIDAMKLLLRAGAAAHVRTTDGETVLMAAALRQDVSMVTVLHDLGYLTLEPTNTTDGNDNDRQGSLLSVTLQTLRESAEQTQEFQVMWRHICRRLTTIYDRLAATSGPQSRENVHRLAMIIFDTVRLKASCTASSVIARLVASPTIASRLRELHTELTHLESGLDSSPSALASTEWTSQYTADERALLDLFRVQIGSGSLLETTETLATDVQLLCDELQVQRGTRSPDIRALMELALREALDELAVDTPQSVPEWFIPPHELDVAFEKIAARTTSAPVRGKRSSAVVLASQFELPFDVFVHAIEQCFQLRHPNVIQIFGASHLQSPGVVVFEDAVSTSLREYLKSDETKHLVWQKLLEASVGLQYVLKLGVGIERLTCDSIWIGVDGVAKICAFRCLALQVDSKDNSAAMAELVRWQAPEIALKQDASEASVVYALARCAVEALTGDVPFGSTTSTHDLVNETIRGTRPRLPDNLPMALRLLLEHMQRLDPTTRPTIAQVVHTLEQFVTSAAHSNQNSHHHSAASSRPPTLDKFVFTDLGCTLETCLGRLETMLDNCREDPEAAQHIYERMREVFALMQAQNRMANDVAVVSFSKAVQSFSRFLGNACRDESMVQRAKSQKVSLQSNVFHLRLDEVLELLGVAPSSSPVHAWQRVCLLDEQRDDADATETCSATEDMTRVDAEAADATAAARNAADSSTRPVKIMRHTPSRLNDKFKELDFDAIDAAVASESAADPAWLIRTHALDLERAIRIGAGAFGEVFKATWGKTLVVVKFMGYEDDSDAHNTALFFHELRVWFPLNHSHVIKLYGACHIGKRYFVCEHAGHGTLLAYLSEKTGANATRTWQLLHQVALGLQHLHDNNILHNDLKCDNVLIGAGGKAKIIDFGLSSILNSAEVVVDTNKQGALRWKSPEYLRGDRLKLAADIYSFGMLILEAVTGEPPWGSQLDAAVSYHVRNKRLPLQPACLSMAQWDLVQMMCAFKPSRRVEIAYVVGKLDKFSQQQQQHYMSERTVRDGAAAAAAS